MTRTIIKILFSAIITGFIGGGALAIAQDVFLLDVKGDVKYVPFGEEDVMKLEMGTSLHEGDKIITGEDSYAIISTDKDLSNVVKIKENTRVLLKVSSNEQLELVDGNLLVFLEKAKAKKGFTVRTPSTICGARGTGWLVTSEETFSEIIVFDGIVFVRGINDDLSAMRKRYTVKNGYSRIIQKFMKPGKEKKVSAETIKSLKQEMMLIVNALELAKKEDSTLKSILLDEEKMNALHNRLEKSDYRVTHNLDRFGGMKPAPVILPAGRGRDDDRKD